MAIHTHFYQYMYGCLRPMLTSLDSRRETLSKEKQSEEFAPEAGCSLTQGSAKIPSKLPNDLFMNLKNFFTNTFYARC